MSAGENRPTVFDPKAFVADLIAAGCHVSVHQPIGPDAGPAYVHVDPADLNGNPTEGEREVRAKWHAAMAACSDHDKRVLVFCQRRVEEAREVAALAGAQI